MKIHRLITEGESEVLEFKASFGKDVIETLCAFANHDQTERRNGSNESRSAFSKLEINFCLFLAESNFVNVLIPFIGVGK